ncbi:MAG: hypothetical protein N4J56_002851 [Chroococcidiopsis sp. SAG 2025]|uniref:hypothetical protein n=1 Tax=Chroococcidiopsis sp. SAG 2025 TaxID=171389 RepID=UPI0029370268|nr:hypothetical protein [Chroococcidiopsis sp. SAG 2025]MDV2993197.1 hypothetical protein [Chroococcidiopsis sp. SAG 2025]
MMDYGFITNADKRQFLHMAVKESLMQRRIQLLKQLSVAYNSHHIKELEEITTFINSLDRYTYTEDAFSTQTLDGVTYRGVTLQQFYGKTLKPNSEVNYVSRQKG